MARGAARLPDADRQPRGRHAARAGARCARPTSSRARTRGARGCCSTATAIRAHARQLPRAQRARAGRRARGADRRRRSVALVTDAGMPLVSDPGFVLVQAAWRRGCAVEVLPGPSAAIDRAGRERAAGGHVALRRLPAAQARGARGRASARRETVVAFESPRRLAASLAVLAELDAERPVAVCRELTKLHEEVVRGDGGGARRALRRERAARRDRAGGRRRARGGRPARRRRWRPSGAWSPRGQAAAGRGRGRRPHGRRARTTSTAR